MSLSGAVSVKRDLGRLIAHALPAKLTFDQACMRQGQFSETYIHNLIYEVATANLSVADHWIRQNYAHPALQDALPYGRRRARHGQPIFSSLRRLDAWAVVGHRSEVDALKPLQVGRRLSPTSID
jgi:hypothetical protein